MMRIKGYKLSEWFVAVIRIIFVFSAAKLLSKILGPSKNWLIAERKDEARDNGRWLFNYLVKEKNKTNVFYVIDNSSKDCINLFNNSQLIQWGSFRHYVEYYRSEAIISTGFDMAAPDILAYSLIKNFLPLLKAKGKKVFLQHGIIKDYMISGTKEKLEADLFVCGALPEYKYILETFGYNDNEVKYLGLPRYDNLFDLKRENFILYMPTWRSWIYEEQVISSRYFRGITKLLTCNDFIEYLKRENIKLKFFLHPKLKKLKKQFEKYSLDGLVEILNNDDCDLQDLLKETSLLITDYSSVFFDVAYMKKPIIYYQFDYEDYRKNQYQEGYFSYKSNGFGPVVSNVDELVRALKNKEHEKIEYQNNSEVFFPMRDKKNCERVYKAINSLIEERTNATS